MFRQRPPSTSSPSTSRESTSACEHKTLPNAPLSHEGRDADVTQQSQHYRREDIVEVTGIALAECLPQSYGDDRTEYGTAGISEVTQGIALKLTSSAA